jgi:uncharacterized protein
MTHVSSPCIRICSLDDATGLCEGCGRTSAEIAQWWRMSEDERLRIMAQLEARMQQVEERNRTRASWQG